MRDILRHPENAVKSILSEGAKPCRPPSAQSGLSVLGLNPAQVLRLPSTERIRLLSFLLRWEWIEELHACLDVLIPARPNLVSLRDLRAKGFLVQGLPDEALPIMQRRLRDRDSLPARALLARIHLARGDTRAARQVLAGLLEERPDSPAVLSLLGELELARGERQAALSAYGRLHELHPLSRAYLMGMMRLYAGCEQWVTASGYAVALLRMSDDRPLSVAHLIRLRSYFQASGEATRLAEIEAALDRRYAAELDDLRHALLPTEKSSSMPRREASPHAPQPSSKPLPSFQDVPVSEQERDMITCAAERFFGFESLLPGQLQTMACVLRGEDVLTILPTGGGKSLCYQLPAILGGDGDREPPARSTTLVISPLIALMKDQVDSLPAALRRRATTINSTLDGREMRRRMENLAHGHYWLVYAAPERLRQPPFVHVLRRAGVRRLVVDEAHCVSMWGHDFRPDYLIIGRIREMLDDPPLLAMTATAPTRVQRDILERLRTPRGSGAPPRLVAGDVTRPNLQLEVFRAADNDAKLRHLLALCRAEKGSGIVYADTRVRSERLAALLRRYGVNASCYHAGLAHRHRVQDDFMDDRTRVVVATIAFGLGIDKPDIRFIVHFFPPSSLEAYYQEAGRAGRDGRPARCVLMISSSDKAVLTRRSRRDRLPVEFLRQVYGAVKQRLAGKSLGRIVMADLERDLRADENRVRVALSLLEEAGLLKRGSDLPRAAAVCLSSVCREEILPDDLAAFCRAARLRPQQSLTLDLADTVPEAGIPLSDIEDRLLTWDQEGWLRFRPVGRDLLIELCPLPEDASQRLEALLDRCERVQMQRVDEIAAYANTRRCRHGHINAYLGGRTIEHCDACDNCVEIPPPPDPGLPDEQSQLLTVLRCVSNAPWSWGRQTLVRILRGDEAGRYGRHALHEKARAQAEFAALAFRSKIAVEHLLERLEREGCLAARRLNHGGVVLDLTSKGRAALKDSSSLAGSVDSSRPGRAAQPSRQEIAANKQESDADEVLFQRLRAWRLDVARERRVPPYVVLHDSHLRALAARRPTTLKALSAVKGFGPKRLERYGPALTALVCGYLQEEGTREGDARH